MYNFGIDYKILLKIQILSFSKHLDLLDLWSLYHKIWKKALPHDQAKLVFQQQSVLSVLCVLIYLSIQLVSFWTIMQREITCCTSNSTTLTIFRLKLIGAVYMIPHSWDDRELGSF